MVEALPADIAELIGRPLYPETADFLAEMAYGWNTLAATENGNPLYWDCAVADALTEGSILPLSTLSLWMRPHRWAPGAATEQVALKVHFELKERLELPEAIMSDNTVVFHNPVRPGDVISHRQVLKSVSGPRTTRPRRGPVLGDRRRVPQPARRPGRHRVLHRIRLPTARRCPDNLRAAAGAQSRETSTATPMRDSGQGQHCDDEPAGPRAKPDPAHDQVRVGDTLPRSPTK